MATFTTVLHVVTCVLIVLVVLMQSGKGAEISSNLGGSSQTIFGNSGGNFFTKLTFGLAAVLMATSVTLTMMGTQSKKSIFEGQVAPTTNAAPVTGAAAPTTAAPANATNTSPVKAKANAERGATTPPETAAPGAAAEGSGKEKAAQ